MRKNKENIDLWMDKGLDVDNRVIRLFGPIDLESAERFISSITLLDRIADKPITILLNTDGGCTYNSMGIYDSIKECQNHITIKVYSKCLSGGVIILQAAEERILTPGATVMFHAGTIEGVENHRDSYVAWAEYDKNKLSAKTDKIIYDSIKSKNPNLSWKKFQEMQAKDKVLTAEEAVEMGLADKVE